MRGRVTEQNGFSLTRQEGSGNRYGNVIGLSRYRCSHALFSSDGGRNFGQGVNPSTWMSNRTVRDGHRPIFSLSGDDIDRATFASCLANSLRKQRMVFAQIRTHYQYSLQL